MTSTTHPDLVTAPGTTVQRRAGWTASALAIVAAIVRAIRREVVAIAAAGQLGPDPDVDVGRRTGARV